MIENARCFHCDSENIKTLGFSEFDEQKRIEIEEIECLDCHRRTRIPLHNTANQLRDNMRSLEAEGCKLNSERLRSAIDALAKKNLSKTDDDKIK